MARVGIVREDDPHQLACLGEIAIDNLGGGTGRNLLLAGVENVLAVADRRIAAFDLVRDQFDGHAVSSVGLNAGVMNAGFSTCLALPQIH